MSALIRTRSGASGQVAILFAMMIGLIGLMGVLTMDVGLLLLDRRDAQGDADSISLAGAIELPNFQMAQQDVGAVALQAARDWAEANGVDPTGELTLQLLWNDECYAGQGTPQEAYAGVKATVRRVPSTIFIGLLPGVAAEVVSTSATACSGTPAVQRRFLPWALPQDGACFEDEVVGAETVRVPRLGERCVLAIAQSIGGSNYGQLGFDVSGDDCPETDQSASRYEDAIVGGVDLSCAVGEYAGSNPGTNVGKTRSGLEERLLTDGSCDSAYAGDATQLGADSALIAAAGYTPLESPAVNDGIDDFYEIWRSPTDPANPAWGLEPNDCDGGTAGAQSSARNVTVIVIEQIDPPDPHSGECGSNTCYEVLGFVRMYIEGCSDALGGAFSRSCAGLTGNNFIIYGRLVSSVATSTEVLGFSRMGDVQTFLKQ